MSLRTADHIIVTSYDAEGRSQTSVERLVPVSDTSIGFWLADAKGAHDRFPDDCVVSVRVCNQRGRAVDTEPVLEGRARIVDEGPQFDEVKAAIHEKYRIGAGLAGVVDRTKELFGGRTPECVVLVNVIG